jgi:hypothetical protein
MLFDGLREWVDMSSPAEFRAQSLLGMCTKFA